MVSLCFVMAESARSCPLGIDLMSFPQRIPPGCLSVSSLVSGIFQVSRRLVDLQERL